MSAEGDHFECPHGYEARSGIVTNQPDDYDPSRAHASVVICGGPSCRAQALAWVRRVTGDQGYYVSDRARKEVARG